VLPAAALSLCCAVFFATPVRAEGNADLMQRSYDSEAVGKLQDSLAALDLLSPPLRDGYVVALRKAWLLYRSGRHPEAIAAYARAISLAPAAVEPRLGMILPQLALRRWGDVETQTRAILKLDPANYLATLRLAFSLYNLQRYAESATFYKKLVDLHPADVEVRAGLGWALLKMGKYKEAAAEFHFVLDIAPRNELAKEGLKALGG